MAAVIRIQKTPLFRKLLPIVSRFQSISTTQSNKDNAASAAKCDTKQKSAIEIACDTKPKSVIENANWVSYGFDPRNESNDRNWMHNTFFCSVTICLVLGGYFLAYRPDTSFRDWAQREAYLQLRYREQNNLPLIDPNLIEPANINLPSDEELGDTEIII